MCDSTVRTDSTSRSAISAFERPRPASSTSWASRAVSVTVASSSAADRRQEAALAGVELAAAGGGAARRVLPPRGRERLGRLGGALDRVAERPDAGELLRAREQPLAVARGERLGMAGVRGRQPRVAALAQLRERRGHGPRAEAPARSASW